MAQLRTWVGDIWHLSWGLVHKQIRVLLVVMVMMMLLPWRRQKNKRGRKGNSAEGQTPKKLNTQTGANG